MADQPKDIAERAAADAKDASKKRDARLREEREASDASTQEQLDRVAGMKPTPTQEEIDRVKLGTHSLEELDDKEPDGSPEQKAALYQTRDTKAAK